MQKIGNFLLGLLVGALAGAVLGLLFAPSSGEELRQDIQTRADQVATDVRTAIAEERERLETELEALKKGEIKIA
jgi:gas vesicle protein